MVMTFVFMTFFSSQRATVQVSEQIENRQTGRTALQLLERDLRMAGSGWSRMAVQGAYDGSPMTFAPITPGYGGGLEANDSIVVMGAWDAATTLKSTLKNAGDAMKVVSTDGFAVNDFVVVTNGQAAHLFQVTSLATGPTITVATSSKYNMTGLPGWPSGGYPSGTDVFRVSWVSYRVDSTAAKRMMLLRREAGGTDQVVAFDIRRFEVHYVLSDGTVTRDPANPLTIERLTPVLYAWVEMPNRGPLEDSTLVTIRPRSF
jgi:hypothetical protein